jgi:hypothetical protein
VVVEVDGVTVVVVEGSVVEGLVVVGEGVASGTVVVVVRIGAVDVAPPPSSSEHAEAVITMTARRARRARRRDVRMAESQALPRPTWTVRTGPGDGPV